MMKEQRAMAHSQCIVYNVLLIYNRELFCLMAHEMGTFVVLIFVQGGRPVATETSQAHPRHCHRRR